MRERLIHGDSGKDRVWKGSGAIEVQSRNQASTETVKVELTRPELKLRKIFVEGTAYIEGGLLTVLLSYAPSPKCKILGPNNSEVRTLNSTTPGR